MATFYFGGPTGNDTNDGSINSPWLNLQYAMLNSGPSDTLVVKQGTAIQTLDRSGPQKPDGRTIIGETGNPRDCILDFNNSVRFSWDQENGLTNTVRGITIQNTTGAGRDPSIFTNGGTTNFINCIFRNVAGGHTGNKASDGNLFGRKDSLGGIINVTSCLFIDIDCLINGQFNRETSLISGIDQVDYNFTNCTVYNSPNPARAGYNKMYSIIGGYNSSIDLDMKNMIFKNDWTSTMYYMRANGPSNDGISIDYSCFDNIDDSIDISIPINNNLFTDPLMVDPANENYNLRPTSPCIGTGTLS